MSLAVSHKRIPEWLSIICSLRTEVGSVGRPHLVWSTKSCVAAAQCSCAHMVYWKAKVASSLRDVWQQLFEQQDITVICTIYFYPWLHENHMLQFCCKFTQVSACQKLPNIMQFDNVIEKLKDDDEIFGRQRIDNMERIFVRWSSLAYWSIHQLACIAYGSSLA